jgi:hypothetical protein
LIEQIEPFHRVVETERGPGWARWTLRAMRLHFTAAGAVLLVGALAIMVYLFALEFERVTTRGLRITRPGGIYEQSIQLQMAGAVALALVGALLLRAAGALGGRRRGAPASARLATLLLLLSLPVGVVAWRGAERVTGGEMVARLLSDMTLMVRLVAVALVIQGVLAAWYWLATTRPAFRRRFDVRDQGAVVVLRRLGWTLAGLGLVAALGLGLGLGVATGWLYELPVPRPQPGELLYATSFDAFNDEWDLYPGRDSAQVEAVTGAAAGAAAAPESDLALVIRYGAGTPDEVVWSALDRKFSDFDLRVTARLLDGPFDQNQYCVAFRYRDEHNFYLFCITADGYYSLRKVRGGVQEKISDWGMTSAIRLGHAPNEMRVIGQGDEFRFFVNGEPLLLCLKGDNQTSMWAYGEGQGVCLTDEPTNLFRDPAYAQGRIALAAGTIDGSAVTVAFDDLTIVGPDQRAE